jgi:hypothetical protein
MTKRRRIEIVIIALVVFVSSVIIAFNLGRSGMFYVRTRPAWATYDEEGYVMNGHLQASDLRLRSGNFLSLWDNSNEGYEDFVIDRENNIVTINAKVMTGTAGRSSRVRRIELPLSANTPVTHYEGDENRGRAMTLRAYAESGVNESTSLWIHIEDDRVISLEELRQGR